MTKILTLKNLSKAFGGNQVLCNFDLDVNAGEILGLLGPNGSGKSTLLDTITGFTPLDSGEVWFKDKTIQHSAPFVRARNGIRRTFQLPAMPEKMTVLEVLMASQSNMSGVWTSLLRNTGFIAAEKQGYDKALAMLEQLSLTKVKDNIAQEISGGQKKLLSIGCALMADPEIILLDEPTAGVHPNVRSDLVDILKKVNQQGITLIVVEHDMHFINALCDRCVVLDRGELIANCKPEELVSHPRVVQAYLGGNADMMFAQGVAA